MRIPAVFFLLLAACTASSEFTPADSPGLTFIHLNDTYRIGAVEDGSRGGFGRVVTVIRELQQQGRELRLLHGGDFLYPSLESQLWNGLQMVDALNFMDELAQMYIVVGNHELDRRTPEHLINAIHASNFDWLGDNYTFATGDSDADTALRSVFTFKHADKTIGVFALTLHADDGGNDRAYAPINKDYAGVALRIIQKLELLGVDAIIGLTHLDLWQDIKIAKFKKDHPRLAFIAGAHEHELKFSAGSAESAPVMKGASNARVIWRIDLTFDDEGLPVVDGQMLDMDTNVTVDAEYAMLQMKWRDRLLDKFPFLEASIGEAALRMDVTEEAVRNRETAWGNFIVDQMLTAFGNPPADVAFINSGSLRIDDFVADEIRFEDIGRTFGFSSFLRHLTMTGAEFRQLIEAGYRGSGGSKGYFPIFAGFRVCVDRGLESGSRIVSLQLPADNGWQEIEAEGRYTVVMPDFLFRGNDGYRVPDERKSSASRPGSALNYLVLDAVFQKTAEGIAIGEPIDPVNPRYVELSPDRRDCWQ